MCVRIFAGESESENKSERKDESDILETKREDEKRLRWIVARRRRK